MGTPQEILRDRALREDRRHAGRDSLARLATEAGLDLGHLAGQVDLALASSVIHEVPQPQQTLAQIAATLAGDGALLLLEPRHEVSERLWTWELEQAREAGLVPAGPVASGKMWGAALKRAD